MYQYSWFHTVCGERRDLYSHKQNTGEGPGHDWEGGTIKHRGGGGGVEDMYIMCIKHYYGERGRGQGHETQGQ